MDILSTVEPIIQKYKPQLIAAAGSQDAVTTDEGLSNIAAELHGLLPFAARAMLSQDTIANFLIANRTRVEQLLR